MFGEDAYYHPMSHYGEPRSDAEREALVAGIKSETAQTSGRLNSLVMSDLLTDFNSHEVSRVRAPLSLQSKLRAYVDQTAMHLSGPPARAPTRHLAL